MVTNCPKRTSGRGNVVLYLASKQPYVALDTFLQHDKALASRFLIKVQALLKAAEAAPFLKRNVLLRVRLLLVYDDAKRDVRMELKMMEFMESYELPAGEPDLDHTSPWDGSETSHADGFLLGVRSLERILKAIADGTSARFS